MSIKKFLNSAVLILLAAVVLTSCQKDELDNPTEEPTENTEVSENETSATTFFTKNATEDEEDWFCFEINFPLTVVYPDGNTQQAADDTELEQIADDFYENQEGSDEDLAIQFPVSLTLEDGTVMTVNSEEEIGEIIFEHCEDEWEDEDDFEMEELCFEINFPISIAIDGTAQTVNNFEEFAMAIITYVEANPDADEDDIEIQFPIDVTLEGGTVITVNDEDGLDELIDNCD